jgi:hypothetical protein
VRGFKPILQHMLNPLHIYCRLRQCGLGPRRAQQMCLAYERFFYRRLL